MKRDMQDLYALGLENIHHLLREMKAGRWTCHGPAFVCEYGLVALLVVEVILTFDIWRKRNVATPEEEVLVNRTVKMHDFER